MRRLLMVAAVALPVNATVAQVSPGCDLLQRAAQEGMALRVAADDEQIAMPLSVQQLTCMDFFYNGDVFNLLTDFGGYAISALTEAAFRTACNAARQAWDSTLGNIQCGITVHGPAIGFGGSYAGGSFCPVVQLGGNGPALAGASLSAGAANVPYTAYAPMAPTGYPVDPRFAFGREW